MSNWPAQCSPLSTVFDLVKLVDEESFRATGGRRDHPILVLDRFVHWVNTVIGRSGNGNTPLMGKYVAVETGSHDVEDIEEREEYCIYIHTVTYILYIQALKD